MCKVYTSISKLRKKILRISNTCGHKHFCVRMLPWGGAEGCMWLWVFAGWIWRSCSSLLFFWAGMDGTQDTVTAAKCCAPEPYPQTQPQPAK